MILQGVYIAGIGSCLPPRVPIADAIKAGLYDGKEAARAKYTSICVLNDGRAAPDLAAAAADDAIAASGIRAADIPAVLYAHGSTPPLSFWNPAAYVGRAAGCASGLLTTVGGGCAAGISALHLACAYLAAGCAGAALVTAADCWPAHMVDRYGANSGLVLADGGAAAVVSTSPGPLRLLSIHAASDAALEPLHRGADAWYTEPPDINRRARDFRATMSVLAIKRRLSAGLRAAIAGAISDAGLRGLDDVAHILLPGVGDYLFTGTYTDPLRVSAVDRTNLLFARRTGHIGTADQFAALSELMRTGRLAGGDHVLLVSEGTGFAWGTAVARVL